MTSRIAGGRGRPRIAGGILPVEGGVCNTVGGRCLQHSRWEVRSSEPSRRRREVSSRRSLRHRRRSDTSRRSHRCQHSRRQVLKCARMLGIASESDMKWRAFMSRWRSLLFHRGEVFQLSLQKLLAATRDSQIPCGCPRLFGGRGRGGGRIVDHL